MNRTTKIISLLLAGLTGLLSACGPGDKTAEQLISEKEEEIAKVNQEIVDLETNLRDLRAELIDLGGTFEEAPDTVFITSTPVVKGNFEQFVHVAGQVTSKNNLHVSSDMGGIVTRVFVTEGQRVNAGQLLAKIDDAVMQNSVNELETQLILAKTIWEKRKTLWEDQHIGSEIEYLQAKTNMDGIEASLNTARSQLAKTEVRSPISGSVDAVFINSGEMAGPGSPIARVINLNRVQVKAQLSELYLGSVGVGDDVELTFNAIDDTIMAKVSAVSEVIDPANRTFTVEVNLSNSAGMLKPNMMADLKLRETLIPDQVMVPTRLIQQSFSGPFVFIIEDGKAERRDVVAGLSSEGITNVKSGLDGTEILVDGGYRNVNDGAVTIVSEF